ncbi:MAG: FAD-dependent oxidoreductase [Microbacterium sp.]
MRITRRSLLIGAGTGTVAVLLASCVSDGPEPSPTTSTPDVSPTPSHDVPAPVGFVRSEWTRDPLSRGGRAFVPVGSSEADRAVLMEPLGRRVFFAGDYLGSPIGSMQGASSDGLRAAALLSEAAEPGERTFVIGAGIAGVRAARFLADAGHEVTLIEGRDRTGGRIRTVELDDWPVAPSLGAWLSDADATQLHEMLADLGIEAEPLEEEAARTEEGETDVPSLDPLRSAWSWSRDQTSDHGLADALSESGADAEDPAVAAAVRYVADLSGADADEQSTWYPPEVPSAQVALQGDLATLVEEAIGDLQVSLSTTVLGVTYDSTGVSLRLSSGEALSADRVIVTAPIGVLQHGSIEFEPALPFAYRSAIEAAGSGAVESVWLRFDERFWDTDAAVWHSVGGDAAIRTWINLEPITGEPILVGLVGGEAARAFAELGDDDAAQAATDSLAFFAAPESE